MTADKFHHHPQTFRKTILATALGEILLLGLLAPVSGALLPGDCTALGGTLDAAGVCTVTGGYLTPESGSLAEDIVLESGSLVLQGSTVAYGAAAGENRRIVNNAAGEIKITDPNKQIKAAASGDGAVMSFINQGGGTFSVYGLRKGSEKGGSLFILNNGGNFIIESLYVGASGLGSTTEIRNTNGGTMTFSMWDRDNTYGNKFGSADGGSFSLVNDAGSTLELKNNAIFMLKSYDPAGRAVIDNAGSLINNSGLLNIGSSNADGSPSFINRAGGTFTTGLDTLYEPGFVLRKRESKATMLTAPDGRRICVPDSHSSGRVHWAYHLRPAWAESAAFEPGSSIIFTDEGLEAYKVQLIRENLARNFGPNITTVFQDVLSDPAVIPGYGVREAVIEADLDAFLAAGYAGHIASDWDFYGEGSTVLCEGEDFGFRSVDNFSELIVDRARLTLVGTSDGDTQLIKKVNSINGAAYDGIGRIKLKNASLQLGSEYFAGFGGILDGNCGTVSLFGQSEVTILSERYAVKSQAFQGSRGSQGYVRYKGNGLLILEDAISSLSGEDSLLCVENAAGGDLQIFNTFTSGYGAEFGAEIRFLNSGSGNLRIGSDTERVHGIDQGASSGLLSFVNTGSGLILLKNGPYAGSAVNFGGHVDFRNAGSGTIRAEGTEYSAVDSMYGTLESSASGPIEILGSSITTAPAISVLGSSVVDGNPVYSSIINCSHEEGGSVRVAGGSLGHGIEYFAGRIVNTGSSSSAVVISGGSGYGVSGIHEAAEAGGKIVNEGTGNVAVAGGSGPGAHGIGTVYFHDVRNEGGGILSIAGGVGDGACGIGERPDKFSVTNAGFGSLVIRGGSGEKAFGIGGVPANEDNTSRLSTRKYVLSVNAEGSGRVLISGGSGREADGLFNGGESATFQNFSLQIGIAEGATLEMSGDPDADSYGIRKLNVFRAENILQSSKTNILNEGRLILGVNAFQSFGEVNSDESKTIINKVGGALETYQSLIFDTEETLTDDATQHASLIRPDGLTITTEGLRFSSGRQLKPFVRDEWIDFVQFDPGATLVINDVRPGSSAASLISDAFRCAYGESALIRFTGADGAMTDFDIVPASEPMMSIAHVQELIGRGLVGSVMFDTALETGGNVFTMGPGGDIAASFGFSRIIDRTSGPGERPTMPVVVNDAVLTLTGDESGLVNLSEYDLEFGNGSLVLGSPLLRDYAGTIEKSVKLGDGASVAAAGGFYSVSAGTNHGLILSGAENSISNTGSGIFIIEGSDLGQYNGIYDELVGQTGISRRIANENNGSLIIQGNTGGYGFEIGSQTVDAGHCTELLNSAAGFFALRGTPRTGKEAMSYGSTDNGHLIIRNAGAGEFVIENKGINIAAGPNSFTEILNEGTGTVRIQNDGITYGANGHDQWGKTPASFSIINGPEGHFVISNGDRDYGITTGAQNGGHFLVENFGDMTVSAEGHLVSGIASLAYGPWSTASVINRQGATLTLLGGTLEGGSAIARLSDANGSSQIRNEGTLVMNASAIGTFGLDRDDKPMLINAAGATMKVEALTMTRFAQGLVNETQADTVFVRADGTEFVVPYSHTKADVANAYFMKDDWIERAAFEDGGRLIFTDVVAESDAADMLTQEFTNYFGEGTSLTFAGEAGIDRSDLDYFWRDLDMMTPEEAMRFSGDSYSGTVAKGVSLYCDGGALNIGAAESIHSIPEFAKILNASSIFVNDGSLALTGDAKDPASIVSSKVYLKKGTLILGHPAIENSGAAFISEHPVDSAIWADLNSSIVVNGGDVLFSGRAASTSSCIKIANPEGDYSWFKLINNGTGTVTISGGTGQAGLSFEETSGNRVGFSLENSGGGSMRIVGGSRSNSKGIDKGAVFDFRGGIVNENGSSLVIEGGSGQNAYGLGVGATGGYSSFSLSNRSGSLLSILGGSGDNANGINVGCSGLGTFSIFNHEGGELRILGTESAYAIGKLAENGFRACIENSGRMVLNKYGIGELGSVSYYYNLINNPTGTIETELEAFFDNVVWQDKTVQISKTFRFISPDGLVTTQTVEDEYTIRSPGSAVTFKEAWNEKFSSTNGTMLFTDVSEDDPVTGRIRSICLDHFSKASFGVASRKSILTQDDRTWINNVLRANQGAVMADADIGSSFGHMVVGNPSMGFVSGAGFRTVQGALSVSVVNSSEMTLLGNGTTVSDAPISVASGSTLNLGRQFGNSVPQGGSLASVSVNNRGALRAEYGTFILESLRGSGSASIAREASLNVRSADGVKSTVKSVANEGTLRIEGGFDAEEAVNEAGGTVAVTQEGAAHFENLESAGTIVNDGVLVADAGSVSGNVETGKNAVTQIDDYRGGITSTVEVKEGGALLTGSFVNLGVTRVRSEDLVIGEAERTRYLLEHLDEARAIVDAGGSVDQSVLDALAAAEAESVSVMSLRRARTVEIEEQEPTDTDLNAEPEAEAEAPVELSEVTPEYFMQDDGVVVRTALLNAPTMEGASAFTGWQSAYEDAAAVEMHAVRSTNGLSAELISGSSRTRDYRYQRNGVRVGLVRADDGYSFGVIGSFADGKVKFQGNRTVQSIGASMFGTVTVGPTAVTGFAAFTSSEVDMSDAPDIDTEVVSAGFRLELPMTIRSAEFAPHVGVRAYRVETDRAQKADLIEYPIGLSMSGRMKTSDGWTIEPSADLTFTVGTGDRHVVTDAGDSAIESELIGRRRTEFLFGVRAGMERGWSADLNWRTALGNDGYRSNALRITGVYAF